MKKKSNLLRKTKAAMATTASIAVATSLVAPLAMTATGCATSVKLSTNIFDKQYGVSKETYEDLKEQFRTAYNQKLNDAGYLKGSEDYEKRMKAFEDDLNYFEAGARQGSFSYTVLTGGLVDFARTQKQKYPIGDNAETEPYGIQLVRHTRAKWSDLNDLYDGMEDSFRTYMHNNRMPASTIKRILADANAKFKKLKSELQNTYGNDALCGLLVAKEKVITYFDDVNDEIALVSSTLRLKDFLSEFNFTYRNDNGDLNCLDTLLKDRADEFAKGQILNNDLMNTIFTVTRKTTGDTVEFDANTIVPGYTLQPKLTSIRLDYETNVHSFSIDFGLIKNAYAQKYAGDETKLNSVTGHNFILSAPAFENSSVSDDWSIADFLKVAKVQPISFSGRLTAKEEAIRLEQTYFNKDSENGSISFKWDMNNQAYEAFFDNATEDNGIWNAKLKSQSLINAGLMISSDNKKFTSIKEAMVNKKSNISSFAYKFLNNCVISSDTVIDETNPSNKIVTHDFKIGYVNTTYKNNIASYDITDDGQFKTCVNFSVSKRFYKNINDKFNVVARFVGNYDNSLTQASKARTNDLTDDEKGYLLELKAQAIIHMTFRTLVLLEDSVACGFAIYNVISAIRSGKAKSLYFCYNALFLCIIIYALQAFDYSNFVINYFKPVIDYVDKVEDANKEIRKQKLMTLLKADLKDSFVIYNSDGSYDEVEFANKMAQFNKKPMTEMLRMYRTYSTINNYNKEDKSKNTDAQNAMMEFNDLLEEKGISPDVFTDQFNDWEFLGKFWFLSFGVGIAIAIAHYALARSNVKGFGGLSKEVVVAIRSEATAQSSDIGGGGSPLPRPGEKTDASASEKAMQEQQLHNAFAETDEKGPETKGDEVFANVCLNFRELVNNNVGFSEEAEIWEESDKGVDAIKKTWDWMMEKIHHTYSEGLFWGSQGNGADVERYKTQEFENVAIEDTFGEEMVKAIDDPSKRDASLIDKFFEVLSKCTGKMWEPPGK